MAIRKYRICNIVPDEKFIDGAIECLNLYADKWDTQWVVCQNINKELQYIQCYKDIIVKLPESKVLDYVIGNKFDAIILHGFGELPPSIIARIPRDIKVFWFGWGYDIYNYPEQKPFLKWNLYKPLTKKYIRPSAYKTLRHLASKIIFLLKQENKLYDKAFNRVDYFSGIVDFEYDLLKQNPRFRAQKVAFSYSNLAGLKSFDTYEKYNGENILLGNSAALTNNHLDMLPYLKNIDLTDRKIIMPLSYAGSKEYVENVVNSYKDVFNDNVIALTEFIPFNEYKQYIQSCSIVVFFTERQQAMGNISTALKYGCKVYLSEKNPVYQYYKNLGMTIFTVEQDFNNQNISQHLTDTEINRNRNILKRIIGYDSFIEKLNTIYNALETC